VVIAQDAQGAELARPWVEKAGGTYRALLDQYNFIGKAYNLKYVPVGIAVDETGRLVRPVGSVNIQDAEFLADLKEWAETDGIAKRWCGLPQPMNPGEKQADDHFQVAIALLQEGKKQEAIARLKKAVRLDPQNWLMRKQLWAIDAPEAFYAGEVNYDWQEARKEAEAKELLKSE
jgi:tetratricopeptide (TPR) repeat protein